MIDHRPVVATEAHRISGPHDSTRANEYPDLDHTGGAHREFARDECNAGPVDE